MIVWSILRAAMATLGCCVASAVPGSLSLAAGSPPRDDDPVKRIAQCRGCILRGESAHDYQRGVRIRYQPGFENDALVFFAGVVGRSGNCRLIAANCLDVAPCMASEIAAIHNSSTSSLWFSAGPHFVRTPFAPEPDEEGFVEIKPGKIAVYRTREHALYCNDIDVYRRLDVRNAKNGRLVVSIEWSARCSPCNEIPHGSRALPKAAQTTISLRQRLPDDSPDC
ncbi:MAG: hypothetical protein H6832_12810 [Planctomycetes bacterium]|nr:hypothetical protein [Planctomycetota bacterium]